VTTLHRHLVYLEAQGVTPLLLRMPLEGALPAKSWFDEVQPLPIPDVMLEENHDNLQPTAEHSQNISEQLLDTLVSDSLANKAVSGPSEKIIMQSSENNSAVANFNFSVFITGHLLLIDEQAKVDRRAQQILLNNIAQSLFDRAVQGQFIDLNWPIKDHRSLDNSRNSAQMFIHTWIESLVARQHIRFIVLLGDSPKEWFHAILDELHLPKVSVAASIEMLENIDKKSECWRLIRSYQALVSSTQIDS
jgi:hypothetical protein